MLQYKCVKLKELRLEQGYTQKHLASLMNISVYKLSKLENLTLMANIYEMAPLTYYLNAKLNYITGESSIRKYPIDLPYGQYEQYEKEHNTIKHKKTRCK
jgi:transcriptional regulator with XRE-family HTH domain